MRNGCITDTHGDKKWYKDGKRHRLDGPAVEYANGTKHWYVDDKEYSEEEFNRIFGTKVGRILFT